MLSAITEATLKVLAFDDALQDARRPRDGRDAGLEVMRFQSVTSSIATREFRDRLGRLVQDLADRHQATLAPYTGPLGTIDAATGVLNRPALPLQPVPLRPVGLTQVVDPADPGPGQLAAAVASTASWLASASLDEQGRWLGDLAAVDAYIRSDWLAQGLTVAALSSSDPRAVVTSLTLLSNASGLSGTSPFRFPNQSFQQYAEDLKDAADRLDAFLAGNESGDAVLADIAVRRARLDQARHTLAASQLGREVARLGVELSGHFRTIAELDDQIASVNAQIAALKLASAAVKEKAAAQQLALQTRLRDLAMARVEGLIQASAKAEQLAAEASARLEAMGKSWKDQARQIRDERKRSFIKGIIKGVIGVVGAVLAPFTGGASLGIASVAITCVDVVDKLATMDWNQPWEALETIGAAAVQIAGGLQKAGVKVDNLLPSDLKAVAGDAQKLFNSARGDIETIKNALGQMRGPVKSLYEAVKAIDPRDRAQVTRLVSSLASGIPPSLSPDGQLSVEFAPTSITFRDQELARRLRAVLDAGGMIVNAPQPRGDVFSGLPTLGDAELKARMKDALAAAFRELPDELQAQFRQGDESLDAVKNRYTEARTQLNQYLAGDTPEADKARRLVAEILASGMVVVQDAGMSVVAARERTEEEIRAVQTRLKDFQSRLVGAGNRAYSEAIEKILQRFKQQEDVLRKVGSDLAAAKNDAELDSLAALAVPAAIKDNKKILDDLKEQIADARCRRGSPDRR